MAIKILGLLAVLSGIALATASLLILYDTLPRGKTLLTYGIVAGAIFVYLGYRGVTFKEPDSPGIIHYP